jgi:hypothetical protein
MVWHVSVMHLPPTQGPKKNLLITDPGWIGLLIEAIIG